MGILLKHDLINTVLPPIESTLPFQPSNLLTSFSSRGTQSITCSLDPKTGTPKYFIGQDPITQLNISEYTLDLSKSSVTIIISLLLKLIFRPDMLSKRYNKYFIFLAFSKSSSRQRIVSSAY